MSEENNAQETLKQKMKEIREIVSNLSEEEVEELAGFFEDMEGFAYAHMSA